MSRAESAADRVKDELLSMQEQATTLESERDELQRRLDMLMENMRLSNSGAMPDPSEAGMMDAGAEALVLSGDNADLVAHEKARVLLERMKAK